MYYDVTQGEFTPVKYQASNNTIKVIWYCYDDQSMIKVHMYSIHNKCQRIPKGQSKMENLEKLATRRKDGKVTSMLEFYTTYK
jgi:hypothetical protein